MVLKECDPPFRTIIIAISTSCAQTPNGWQYISINGDTATLMTGCADKSCKQGCTASETYPLQVCGNSGINATIFDGAVSSLYKPWIYDGYGVSIEYESTICANPYRMVARPIQQCFWNAELSSYEMDYCKSSNSPSQTYITTSYADPGCTEAAGRPQSYTSGTCVQEEAATYFCPGSKK